MVEATLCGGVMMIAALFVVVGLVLVISGIRMREHYRRRLQVIEKQFALASAFIDAERKQSLAATARPSAGAAEQLN